MFINTDKIKDSSGPGLDLVSENDSQSITMFKSASKSHPIISKCSR